MAKTFKGWDHHKDGIDRCSVSVWLHLTRNQLDVLDRLAKAAGKKLPDYLHEVGEAAIASLVPAEAP